MSMFPQSGMNQLEYGRADTGEQSRVVSQFFNQVYLWMGVGLAWTAVVSSAFAYMPALRPMVTPGLGLVACLAAFGVAMATQKVALRMSFGAGIALFMLYTTLIGFMIAPVWLVYKQSTIGVAFLLTGGVFFATSLVGFVTKINLSRVGSIAVMIAFGLIAASVVNYFVASNLLSWVVTYGIVIIFPIIVAWQTQDLKTFALEHGTNGDLAARVALLGALSLYIAFINIFLSILRILGDRR